MTELVALKRNIRIELVEFVVSHLRVLVLDDRIGFSVT